MVAADVISVTSRAVCQSRFVPTTRYSRYDAKAGSEDGIQLSVIALAEIEDAGYSVGAAGFSPTRTLSMNQPSMTTLLSVRSRNRTRTPDMPAAEVRSNCSRVHAARVPV